MSEDLDLEAATVAAKVRARRSEPISEGSAAQAGAAGTGPSAASKTAGPHSRRALLAGEVARARGMAALLGVICAVGFCWFPLLGGVHELQIASMAGVGQLGLVCLLVNRRARPDRHYRFLFRLFGVSAVAASFAIELYVGLFSPAPIVVPLGISFFGTADDRRWGVGICLTATAGYALMAVLIALGVMPDVGLIRGLSTPTGQLFGVVMVPFIFVGTVWQAMLGRRATHDAIKQVEDATRVVQQREAQLAEANLDLQHALEAGAGKTGRHTGRQAGAWVLGPVIGRGAMGEVYAAAHQSSAAPAAVKILVGAPTPDQLMRFRREAEIAARLKARTVVALHEAGMLDDDTPYLAMELLAGHDLAWHLRKTGQLGLTATIALCTEVAAGLGAAHRAGIVHRDIKPQNLFRHEPTGGEPVWKILDFGVSKLRGSHGTLTQNRVIGTPGYMSPEQARGLDADERSDVFALGAVLYRALTGQPPFLGGDTPQILFDVVYRMPRRPGLLAPDLPTDLDRVLAIALAKRPADRFAGPDELAVALRAAADGALDPTTRARGIALIENLPWGARLKE